MEYSDNIESTKYIDKVLTIHNYFDGLIDGIATLHGKACIYECDGWENGDFELFYLTPIDIETYDRIMEEWEKWIEWVEVHESAEGWLEEKKLNIIHIAKQSKEYRLYTKHGNFHGGYKNFHSHIDNLFVEWTEP